MNENIEWGRVKARPLIDAVPEQATKDFDETEKLSKNNCAVGWGKLWKSNLEKNVKIVGDLGHFGIYKLSDRWAGETAYLFGGGPSLKYNIMDFKGGGKVFTSTHTLKFILDKGIKVDYVGVVDAYARHKNWIDIGTAAKDMTLLMDINCHPDIFKKWKGNIIFFRTVGKGEGLSGELWKISPMEHLIACGGNVMTAMMSCAFVMGMRKFVFVGHDYCNENMGCFVEYADGHRDYGSTTRGRNFKFYDAMIDIDISGKGVATLCRMWTYKYWTESFAQSQKDKCDFINATEGGMLGAYPEGNLSFIKQMRLSEV